MRHAGSLFLSLFLAPLIWVATGYGTSEIFRGTRQFTSGFDLDILLGLAALIAGGALYAVLVMARLSPIGPALIGLVFLGLTTWAAFDPSSYFDTMPTDLQSGDQALTYPALAWGAVLAVPLLATVLSPRRWRRYASPPAPVPAYGAPMGAPGGPVPPYGLPPGATPPPQGGFGATPGYLAQPLSPPPPRPADPAPTTAFQASPPPPLPPPPSYLEQATTRLNPPSPPVPSPPPLPPPPSPAEATTRITAPTAEPTTTRLNAPDGEATQLLKGPPPPDAYPRPAWSAPTPPPITPPGARTAPDDDPEATQPSR
ncbi:hypothetical protein [Phytohabitans rumicis]|uniref:Uncharacterized protein n=1 Tax=Phytohabitans rumicis TaxID=1076125 RepID=A0A6V8L5F5_9ACTN|nr:hypothetical protein [Phytohabitans rumicis]GFJ91444.1 hypothetical protein Prum_050860 [Phytohabitans rumicis]